MEHEIAFRNLGEVNTTVLMALMNHPLVRRQMPLLREFFDERACEKFIAAKAQLWSKYGYGPWAFFIGGQFAGWGGLQPQDGEADLALVLHPDYWGKGKDICERLIEQAFTDMRLPSVTILFPPTRTRIKGLLKLGFIKESEITVGEQPFIKYRLKNPIAY